PTPAASMTGRCFERRRALRGGGNICRKSGECCRAGLALPSSWPQAEPRLGRPGPARLRALPKASLERADLQAPVGRGLVQRDALQEDLASRRQVDVSP